MSIRGGTSTKFAQWSYEVAYSSSVSKFENEIDMGLIISASIRVIKKLLPMIGNNYYK